MSKKTIYLKITINSEMFDDISDGETLKVLGIRNLPKDGITVEQIAAPVILPAISLDTYNKEIKLKDKLNDNY